MGSYLPYSLSRILSKRRSTREVKVAHVGIGGSNPIRLQSMTNTSTFDVNATVKQTLALIENGCEIVRITAQNLKAAEALGEIRKELDATGSQIPLVADIHFLPAVAMEAVKHVDKIRINPGNFADKKKFAILEYTDQAYQEELDRIYETFSPLVKRCKELGRSMRIGTNHGSLSDRIMNRYGDTPLGMVESAMEFIRVAESHGYYDIILSMKASNPKVMIEAYRLATARMLEENMHYPLHLGVTEAGDGEDARIKSAIGIGSLLLDGLGDTIRVSLTEDPAYEIPVAKALAACAEKLWSESSEVNTQEPLFTKYTSILEKDSINPYAYTRRPIETNFFSVEIPNTFKLGLDYPPRVVAKPIHSISQHEKIVKSVCEVHARQKECKIEGLLLPVATQEDLTHAQKIQKILTPSINTFILEIINSSISNATHSESTLSIDNLINYLHNEDKAQIIFCVSPTNEQELQAYLKLLEPENTINNKATKTYTVALNLSPSQLQKWLPSLQKYTASQFIITSTKQEKICHPAGTYRLLAQILENAHFPASIWIRYTSAHTILKSDTTFQGRLLESSLLTGSLLCDGIGDIVSVENEPILEKATVLAYNILQGTRLRMTKTEFVACPSCGRTLFDLESTTQKIRAKTGHLKGVTIAIMGCIVNGPGEMADADFGYVGGAPGKINLYVRKDCVEYNILEEHAVEKLITLIKDHGKWVEAGSD